MHKEPIFSLPVLFRKLYIVQCPQIISQIQRNTRSLTFTPFALGLLNRLMDMEQETMDKVSHGWDSDSLEERQNTLHANLERVHLMTLSPGPELNKLLSIQLRSASAKINAVSDGTAMDVWQWLRHVFLISSMDALLGP